MPPVGLVYRDQEGFWRVASNGEPELIYEVSMEENLFPSPDYKHFISFVDTMTEREFWITETETNNRVKLDPGEEYFICGLSWWKARLDAIIATVEPIDEAGGMHCEGMPAIFSFDGKLQHVIGDQPHWDNAFALSPDGNTLAFSQAGEPWIYEWGIDSKQLNLKSYGFPEMTRVYLSHPAWSSSGRLLAWTVSGVLNDEEVSGVGIFDTRSHTSTFLYPFASGGYDAGSNLYWLPDEQQIILDNYSRDIHWLLDIDGSSATELTEVPYISPNGEWFVHLAFDRFVGQPFAFFMRISDESETHEISFDVGPSDRDWFNNAKVNWTWMRENVIIWTELGRDQLLWSPDGRYMIISSIEMPEGNVNYLIDTETWQISQIDLPSEAEIIQWMATEEK